MIEYRNLLNVDRTVHSKCTILMYLFVGQPCAVLLRFQADSDRLKTFNRLGVLGFNLLQIWNISPQIRENANSVNKLQDMSIFGDNARHDSNVL